MASETEEIDVEVKMTMTIPNEDTEVLAVADESRLSGWWTLRLRVLELTCDHYEGEYRPLELVRISSTDFSSLSRQNGSFEGHLSRQSLAEAHSTGPGLA